MSNYSTTSYAVLGLLARHPWSAYELNVYLRTSTVAFVWPRAASRLYQEPKNLVASELATVHNETLNGRKRSIYSITEKGKQVLYQWLAQDNAHFNIESESMLKIAYADAGSIELLRSQISTIKNFTMDEIKTTLSRLEDLIGDENYTPGVDFSLELHLMNLISKLQQARLSWLQEVESNVIKWQTVTGPTVDQSFAKSRLNKLKGELEQLLEEHSS